MADVLPLPSTPCQWYRAWIGPCRKPSDNGWCSEHEGKKCASCGGVATRDCDYTGIQFVCGSPLCENCTHGLVMPGEPMGMFNLGGGHITREKYHDLLPEYDRRMDAYLAENR